MATNHTKVTDVLFVNPPSPDGFVYIRDVNRHGRSSWERMIWPQTNLAYLAAVAEKAGMTVDIVDCIAEEISWPQYEEIIGECKPRFCVGNIISATYENDVRALKRAKEISGAVIVGMGPHITDSPARSLKEAKDLEFVICHEAEGTLEELLSLYKKSEKPTVSELKEVKGLGFVPARIDEKESDKPFIAEQRPFVNLDELPRPRHDLLPLHRYWAPFLGNYSFVQASRGCTYRCIFCRQAVMWQWQYRRRSGKKVAEEALYVHSLGVETILFHADTFTLNRELVEELCDTLIEAGTPFRWACNAHVASLVGKGDLLQKMRRAGCWMIAIGVESGDDEILKTIKKGCTVAQAKEVVEMVDKAGIEAWGYFVLGFPGDTLETMERTAQFSRSLPLKIAKFDIAAPYPGTEFHQFVKEKNYLKFDKYEDFDQNASAVVEYPDLSRAQIKKAVKWATIRFYLRPMSILRLIREALRFRSLTTGIRIVFDFMRMLAGVKRSGAPAR